MLLCCFFVGKMAITVGMTAFLESNNLKIFVAEFVALLLLLNRIGRKDEYHETSFK